ncbi:MAG TPA: rhomboid family intramembrane serine protease [Terriglobia bacterium]|nr:rhomboid family intramembrane serine protease [Terriglobia bacterium]
MSRYSRTGGYGSGYGGGYGIGYPIWSPVVRILIITCVIVFLLQNFARIAGGLGTFEQIFGLSARDVTQRFFLWQLVTYIFLHDGVFHILFNMLALWMLGSDLERTWGGREFTRFFFICGIGAGISTVFLETLFGQNSTTIGASGAIYGILLAYGMHFPNRIIYLLIFPIPAKWFVVLMGGLAFFSALGPSSGVANVAHLGGMLFGFLYLKFWKGGGGGFRGRYDRWRRDRMRKKFNVYYGDRYNDPPEDLRWRRWK